jgi:hypothetical protein
MTAAGATPANIRAVIGPTIAQASYEVGPDFHAAMLAGDAASAPFFVPGARDRLRFDLPGYCLARLERAGVGAAEALPLDTYALSDDFHSHRRHVHLGIDDYGRNCAAIALT